MYAITSSSGGARKQPLQLLRQLQLLRRALVEHRADAGIAAAAGARDAPRRCSSTGIRSSNRSSSTSSSADPLGPPPTLPQRRVVVTGIGIVSPLAVGAAATWSRILRGDTAVRELAPEDLAPADGGASSGATAVAPPPRDVFESLPSRVGACVPRDELRARAREAADKAADKARARQREFGSCSPPAGGGGGGGGGSGGADAAPSSSSSSSTDKAVAAAAERALASFDPRRAAPFMIYALVAAQEAMDDAQWHPMTAAERGATAVFVGAGMPAAAEIAAAGAAIGAGRVRRVSPFFVPRILPNLAAGSIAIAHGLRGPNHAASTACATGLHAIGDAFRALQRGEGAVALAGATEAAVDAVALGGFARLKGLSTAYTAALDAARAAGGGGGGGGGGGDANPPHPAASSAARSSRPFDAARDGFVLGEGAAVLVLEDLEHARRRGARAYAEVRAYGMSGDACHVTQPHVRGLGASLAMRRALAGPAGAGEADRRCLRHVNAHATSTPMGDDVEALAIARVFADGGDGAAAAAACGAGEPDEDAGEYLAALRRGGRGAPAAAPAPANNPLSGLAPLDRVAVSSTKGATGHLLGAAGAVEAAFTALAVADRVAPPTANLEAPDPLVTARLPLLVGPALAAGGGGGGGGGGGDDVQVASGLVRGPYALGGEGGGADGPISALCNSFGFGGTNAAVLFATPPEDVARGRGRRAGDRRGGLGRR
jgi:3-oxoacyl-[acyl-carrier-protein] synthase II